MVPIIQGKDVTLNQLIEHFHLQRRTDSAFFPEWQENLPDLSDLEIQSLNQVKEEYLHISRYPILEPVVKMVVLSPLLRLAGFYRPPFYIASEQEINICSTDEEIFVKGRIDVLLFQPTFWVLVIEAKRAYYSLTPAIPQALTYMLAHPEPSQIAFGLVTNGGEFRFIKLLRTVTPEYALSDLFALDSRDDLYTVVRILKHQGELVCQR